MYCSIVLDFLDKFEKVTFLYFLPSPSVSPRADTASPLGTQGFTIKFGHFLDQIEIMFPALRS